MNTLLSLLRVCNNMAGFVSEAEPLKQCCFSSYTALNTPKHPNCLDVQPEPNCIRCLFNKRFSFLHAKAKGATRMPSPQGGLCRGCCGMPAIAAVGSVRDGSRDNNCNMWFSMLLGTPQHRCGSLLLLCQLCSGVKQPRWASRIWRAGTHGQSLSHHLPDHALPLAL